MDDLVLTGSRPSSEQVATPKGRALIVDDGPFIAHYSGRDSPTCDFIARLVLHVQQPRTAGTIWWWGFLPPSTGTEAFLHGAKEVSCS